ncbi:MVP [Lepeophtheirus salmonis]|uniref:MVP n=1 Tax=Lepeophtheirus salmonis TaxID=72036 RepID=A0A7R8CAS3_LEPSM|nr:MVP [Lepeophtheirus salmonis]CAF2751642.1 MVP [Lepeophtheirus salmonis]
MDDQALKIVKSISSEYREPRTSRTSPLIPIFNNTSEKWKVRTLWIQLPHSIGFHHFFICTKHDIVVLPPTKMTIIPPGYYCVVSNPVITKDDVVEKDTYGQAKLSHGDEEVRLERDPFPLYPGEELKVKVTPLAIVHTSNALLLKVIRNFTDENDVKRKRSRFLKTITAQIIHENEALKLSASRETIDRSGIKHVADVAILVRAKATFKDKFGVERKNGDKYLITFEDTSAFIPEVQEEIIGTVDAITLDSRQYCTILNPHDSEGKAKLGHRKIVKGEISFFLKPGEVLEDGINEVYILGEDEEILEIDG